MELLASYNRILNLTQDIVDDSFSDDAPEVSLIKEDIMNLIKCEKIVLQDLPTERSKIQFEETNAQKVFKISLVAESQRNIAYLMHVRQSVFAPENYSIPLTLIMPTKNICLLRCNGPHGEPDNRNVFHTCAHNHTCTSEDLIARRLTDPSHRELAPYSSLKGAIDYFVSVCNIVDVTPYLPKEIAFLKQMTFDDYGR
ncbi:MAG TPA: hypothetical protein GX734_03000 [Clostridiaceae bacterium]|nr:hypothetical protein [Clostridiaceae bacterium]